MLMDRRKKTLQDFEIAPQKDESITKTDLRVLVHIHAEKWVDSVTGERR